MNEASGSGFALPATQLARRIRQRKKPVQARARSTVDAILGATLQVLDRHGYRKLTTTRVAERAGVSVGTLYQYYPDKRALVTALKVQYFERLMGSVAAAAEASHGLPLVRAVRAMLTTLVRTKQDNLRLTLALREPLAELGGAAFMREATGQLVGVTARLLAATAPRLADPVQAARVVVAAVDGVVSAAVYESPELLGTEAFVDELEALVVGYVERLQVKRREPRARSRSQDS